MVLTLKQKLNRSYSKIIIFLKLENRKSILKKNWMLCYVLHRIMWNSPIFSFFLCCCWKLNKNNCSDCNGSIDSFVLFFICIILSFHSLKIRFFICFLLLFSISLFRWFTISCPDKTEINLRRKIKIKTWKHDEEWDAAATAAAAIDVPQNVSMSKMKTGKAELIVCFLFSQRT